MGVFKKGYTAVREEKQRQEENREKLGKSIWRFFLKNDSDEADVVFLTSEPVNFKEHTIRTFRNGKESYDGIICTQDADCNLCSTGDKPTFRGAFLIYDMRPFDYTDKDGKQHKGKGTLKLYVQGTKVLSQLDRINSRYGLTNRIMSIVRLGTGTSTTYTFEKGEEIASMSHEEIKNLLPEKLRAMYKGNQESLMNIIEESLMSVELDSSPATSGSKVSDDSEELVDSKEVPWEEDADDGEEFVEVSKTSPKVKPEPKKDAPLFKVKRRL